VTHFKKSEHLCLQKEIDALFAARSGTVRSFPFIAIFRVVPMEEERAKVLLSVPKRRLRHAVDRNRTKRLLRESYRLNKDAFLAALPADVSVHIGFVWQADEVATFDRVERKMREVLAALAQKVSKMGETHGED